MIEFIYKSEFCELGIHQELKTLYENWHLANCPLEEFKKVCFLKLEAMIEKELSTLLINAYGAISLLPEEHHFWLDTYYNKRLKEDTKITTIILINPESLVTQISADKFYENLLKGEYGLHVIRLKTVAEAWNWLKSKKEINTSY